MIYHGDNIKVLKGIADNSIDSVMTDPPYGLGKEPDAYEVMRGWVEKGYHEVKGKGGFMGKEWDKFVPQPVLWKEVYRVLKPGGHMLVFGGTRTYDWMVMALRFAGFEVRDTCVWCYGSGFPKSLNISKQIQKNQNIELEDTGIISPISRPNVTEDLYKSGKVGKNFTIKNVTTPEAQQWEGWGTGLKPAVELICLARNPISEKNIAENVLKWGVGGLNIDGCRIETNDNLNGGAYSENKQDNGEWGTMHKFTGKEYVSPQGRFPANFIHSGEDEVVQLFPNTKSGSKIIIGGTPRKTDGFVCTGSPDRSDSIMNYGDSGSAARFFYAAKASKAERDFGLDGFEDKKRDESRKEGNPGGDNPRNRGVNLRTNNHPTVKPLSLMRYLCRLITPPSGICLDPFAGSGTTGIACKLEGFEFIGIEKEKEYCKIAEVRIEAWKIKQQDQLSLEL